MLTVLSGEMDVFRIGEAIMQSNSHSSARQEMMMKSNPEKMGNNKEFEEMLKSELNGLSIA